MRENEKSGAEREKRLKAARRLVIKVGTSTVTGAEGELCTARMEPIVRSISSLMKGGGKWCWFHRARWDWEEGGWVCTARG